MRAQTVYIRKIKTPADSKVEGFTVSLWADNYFRKGEKNEGDLIATPDVKVKIIATEGTSIMQCQ